MGLRRRFEVSLVVMGGGYTFVYNILIVEIMMRIPSFFMIQEKQAK